MLERPEDAARTSGRLPRSGSQKPKAKRRKRRLAKWLRACLLLGALVGITAGCNRSYYRRQSDEVAFDLIQEKAQDPRWALQDYEIYIDPRSRMFDPFDPDVPPLPPDDPAAHEYMHEVYGMKGYPGWHYSGETPFVENPAWRDYLPLDEHGILRMDGHLAHQLGRIHSRNYQAELEELYLSALDVSFERFRFDSQFFAGYQLFSSWDGRNRRAGGGESRTLFTAATNSNGRNGNSWTMQRSFASGGDLVVGFANSLVWQFAGPNDYAGATILDFSLLQPLLRGAGRDRILERLTLSERTLLGNVRAMERYRRAFYVELMTGRNAQATDGPQRRGGVLGGSGLEGFSGSGTGGFGRLATTAAGGAGGVGNTGAGAGQAGGFIGLLQQRQQIRNQEDNIARLRTNLYRLETGLRELLTTVPARQEQIPQQRLQVAQSRQALVLAESRLINSRNQYEAQLDTYKGTLGLPPDVCIEVDDPMLDQFQLISQQLQTQQKRIDAVIEDVGVTNDKVLANVQEDKDAETDLTRRTIAWSDKLAKELDQLDGDMRPVGDIHRKVSRESIAEVGADLKRLRDTLPQRVAAIERLRQKYEEQKDCLCPLLPVPSINPVVLDVERLKSVDDAMTKELDRLSKKFADYDQKLKDFHAGMESLRKGGKDLEATELFDKVRDGAVLASQQLLTDLRLDLLALELCQARVRTFTIDLVPVDVPAPVAMEIASQLRPDLMNARAALVDSWRLIEFNADNLESTLNIVFSGDLTNQGQNPFDLRANTGRLRAGLQWDAPIVRISERNTYRQSLIEYQQARRNFYNSLDGLSRGLRSIVRTIETNQFNFEIQRYAVLAAIEQIDLNEDIRVLNEALRQPTGVTAARDSVSALNDLLNAQNDFLSIWINYELQRMWLDLDMGTMELNDEGAWVDPGAFDEDFVTRVRGTLGLPEEGESSGDDAEGEMLPPPVAPQPQSEGANKKPSATTRDAQASRSPAASSRPTGTAPGARNASSLTSSTTNEKPASPKAARLGHQAGVPVADSRPAVKPGRPAAGAPSGKVAASAGGTSRKEVAAANDAPAPPQSYSLPQPPSLAFKSRGGADGDRIAKSVSQNKTGWPTPAADGSVDAQSQGEPSPVAKTPGRSETIRDLLAAEPHSGEPTPAARSSRPSGGATERPRMARRPSLPVVATAPSASDDEDSTGPRKVHLAPVYDAPHRDTVAIPSDQPQPVTIRQAAAIEPILPTEPEPAKKSVAPPPQPPKSFRPGAARRIGG